MNLLCEMEGKNILLAQQESPSRGFSDRECDWIRALTGDLPAIRGLDFIHDDYAGVVERARRFDSLGGIVTICWHTGLRENHYPASKEENPDWERIFREGTEEHRLLLDRWDRAAEALGQLQSDGIPVLWRPFHEFDGQWFWWGKEGPEAFRQLWAMMHEYFEDRCGLHNLIWVLGYSGEIKEGWEVDPALFDAVGSDTYSGETTHAEAYRRLREMYPGKLLCFHECGLIPPVDAFFDEGSPWSWIMPWHSGYLLNNHPSRILEAYRDARMVTLKRLPRF